MSNFEYESNDTTGTANTGEIGINSGQLSSITDKDIFKFTLTEPTLLGIKFTLPEGTTADYFIIKFLDSSGINLFSNNIGADLSNLKLSADPGDYYVEISANAAYLNSSPSGALFTDQYSFAVSTPPSVTATGEVEGNDIAADATQILLGNGTPLVDLVDTPTVIGNLNDKDDKDFFKFAVAQGEGGLYSFKFTVPSNGEPDVSTDSTIKEFFRISILDASQNVLISHFVSDTPLTGYTFDFNANLVGDYFVKIENGGSTTNINTQQYNFEINSADPTVDNSNIINGGKSNNSLLGSSTNDIIKGFAGKDILSGMAGNDWLDGGVGIDTMKGGLGNDTYVIDTVGDSAIENSGAGIDKVISTISYTLVKNVENLVLGDATVNAKGVLVGAIKGTGNALDNIIVGNQLANTLSGLDGNDTLDGGVGAKGDALTGGRGDDTYYINNVLDKITEASTPGSGVDTVLAKVDIFALAANVENLKLMEMGVDADGSPIACYGVGNILANTITGNSEVNQLSGLGGNDILYGLGGNDALNGGAGNDQLIGGAGSDYFIFNTALTKGTTANVDTIVDFTSGVDAIDLSGSIFKKLVAGPNENFDGELSIDHFRAGTAAADSDDYIIYDQTTGNLYYDADGNVGQAAILFANLGSGTDLAYTDFTVL